MKPTSLLGHTFELFNLVEHDRHPADQVVDKFFRARRYLGSKDRRFIAEAIYGMLRHKLLIEKLFESALRKVNTDQPSTNRQSTVGLYLTYLLTVERRDLHYVCEAVHSYWMIHYPRVPVTAIAEEVLRHRDLDFSEGKTASRLSFRYSFPIWMVEEWLGRLGEAETEALCVALNTPALLTIRVNTLKTSVEECQEGLQQEGIEATRTKLSPFGLVLGKRVNLPSLRSFKEGWFEAQDEASQLIPLLLNPQPGEFIIDACAGGGGKTLELAALMKNQGKIIALDVDEGRLRNLQRRAERAGVQNVDVRLTNKGSEVLGRLGLEEADAVLVDAPCSGLGTLRRNPGNKWRVSPAFVEQVAAQQRKLSQQWSSLVKSGGRLVYATCTLLQQENEDVVEDFLANHRDFKLVPPVNVLTKFGLAGLSQNGYLYLYPHRHGTDGFFAAVMVRS